VPFLLEPFLPDTCKYIYSSVSLKIVVIVFVVVAIVIVIVVIVVLVVVVVVVVLEKAYLMLHIASLFSNA